MSHETKRRYIQAQRIRRERRRLKLRQLDVAIALNEMADELDEPSLRNVDSSLIGHWESKRPDRWVKLADAHLVALSVLFGKPTDFLLAMDVVLADPQRAGR